MHLEQVRQGRVAVGNVPLPRSSCRDHISQGAQTPVDVLRLPKGLTRCSRLVHVPVGARVNGNAMRARGGAIASLEGGRGQDISGGGASIPGLALLATSDKGLTLTLCYYLPEWRDWRELRRFWRHCCPGGGGGMNSVHTNRRDVTIFLLGSE